MTRSVRTLTRQAVGYLSVCLWCAFQGRLAQLVRVLAQWRRLASRRAVHAWLTVRRSLVTQSARVTSCCVAAQRRLSCYVCVCVCVMSLWQSFNVCSLVVLTRPRPTMRRRPIYTLPQKKTWLCEWVSDDPILTCTQKPAVKPA